MNKATSHAAYLSEDTSNIIELSPKTDAPFNAPCIHESVTQNVRDYFKQLGDQDAHELYQLVLGQVEPALLSEVLKHTRGNQSKAAELLGLNRGTLRKKLQQYGLDA